LLDCTGVAHGISEWSFEWVALNRFSNEFIAQELEPAACKFRTMEKARREK